MYKKRESLRSTLPHLNDVILIFGLDHGNEQHHSYEDMQASYDDDQSFSLVRVVNENLFMNT